MFIVPGIVAFAAEASTIPTKTTAATAQIAINFLIPLYSFLSIFALIFTWFTESSSLPPTRKPDVPGVPRDTHCKIYDWALASSLLVLLKLLLFLVLLRSYFSLLFFGCPLRHQRP
jgi:hypothetical protein